MNSALKVSLTAVMMTSVAISAIATVTTLASVEPAYAKSENSSNKSDGNHGKSSEARDSSGSKGKSNERSTSRGKSGGEIEGFFGKLTGKDNRAAKATQSERPAKPPRVAKSKKTEEGAFHPSELGNMNGALNANINAVLAHIRNGNGNGPVGHVAVLAAATASAEGSQVLLDRAALFEALVNSPYGSVEEYYSAIDGATGNEIDPEIEAAEDKDVAAIAADFDSYDDYLGQLEVPPAEFDDGIDRALADLGFKVESRGAVPDNLALDPSSPEVAGALESQADKTAAEQSILAYWNKNPGGEANPDTGRTPEEDQLLSDLRNRFSEQDRIAIQEAVDNAVDDMDAEEECGEAEDLCLTYDEVADLSE